MPVYQDFNLVKYEDGVLTVTMAPPVNITYWNIEFDVTKRFGETTPKIRKSCASGFAGVSGIELTNAGVGIFSISINSVDTSGWDPGNYAYQASRLNSGVRTVLSQGYMMLE